MTEETSSPRKPAERRGFIRIPFRTETLVRAGGQIVRAIGGIDISMSGLRIETEDPVPAESTPCEAQIVLEASEPDRVVIEAKGAVAWSRTGALAVRFTEIDLDSYQHLRQLILMNADQPEMAENQFIAGKGIHPRRA